MPIDRNKFKITRFSDSELYEIQSGALLVSVDQNPVFSAPVTSTGEQYTAPTTGDDLASATQSVSTGVEAPGFGPTVVSGTDTDDIISILVSDIGNYFIGTQVQTIDDVNRLLLGTPAEQKSWMSTNVCVLNDQITNVTPTYQRDTNAVAAVFTNKGIDTSTILPAVYTDPTLTSGEMSQYTTHSFQPGLIGMRQKNALIASLKSLPMTATCSTGTYQATYTSNKYVYGTPYRLDDPINVTGYTYTDENGATGTLIDDQLPTPYVYSQHVYTPGAPEFVTLDSVLSQAGQAAISGKSFNIAIRFVQVGSRSDIPLPSTDDRTVIGAINELDVSANTAKTNATNVELSVWKSGVGDWRLSQNNIIEDPSEPGTNIFNLNFDQQSYDKLITLNPEWDTLLALRKLNLIPIDLQDKIMSPETYVDATGEERTRYVIDPDSQVNLLEAMWTAWRNITNLNTDVYGISATNMPDLSSTALSGALSGNSVIENLDLLYNMILSGGSGGGGGTVDPETGEFIPSTTQTQLSALSGAVKTNTDTISANVDQLTTLQQTLTALTQIQSLSTVINTLTGIDTVTLVSELSGLEQDFTTVNNLSSSVGDLINKTNELYEIDIPDLTTCCAETRQELQVITNRFDTLNTTELSGIAEMIQAIDIDNYVTQLSAVENQLENLNNIQTYVTQIIDNTANIQNNTSTFENSFSTLSGDVYNTLQTVQQQVTDMNVQELSAIVSTINNLQDIDTLLQTLTGQDTITNLQTCCESNNTEINNINTQVQNNILDTQTNTTNILQLSSAVTTPTGVVLTTTDQTIAGEKKFNDTLTVSASSHFEDCVTVGDTSQPAVFNVYTADGFTRINMKNLPTSTQTDALDPGDLYTHVVDGHTLLAIKQ